MPERTHDRTAPATYHHYNMKTASRPQMSSPHSPGSRQSARHSQSNSQSFRANKSTTPLPSPHHAAPFSVGQPYPPSKLSPAVASDVRTPSPNYFGLNIEPTADPRDSGRAPRDLWSPSSSIKSFNQALPQQVPLDANPEFEAFRRQAEANQAKLFSLNGSYFGTMQSPASLARPKPPRWPTNQSDSASEKSISRPPRGKASRDMGGGRLDVETDSLHDSAYVSSDSKRNSEVSLNAPSLYDMPWHESPAQAESPFQPLRRSNLSRVEDAHPRLSLPQNRADQPPPDFSNPLGRSETLPSSLEGGPGLLMPVQLKYILQNSPEHDFLLLDVRVSTHYGQARIRGALNLCIPTTLLKRASFNLQKLQKTLQTEEDQTKFSQWRNVKYLIVYDTSSSEKRDALSAMNMIKKFTNEGYAGSSFLLRGGFQAFASSYPDFIDHRTSAERAGNSTSSSGAPRPVFAPVIGGVTLPAAEQNSDPFFSNIRQNMDLADGVGQLDLNVPLNFDGSVVPRWLRDACAAADHGKGVSDKFLRIERNEQARMRDAYSSFNSTLQEPSKAGKVVLSGVEKGAKNRYKDILPFEHARVHLPDKPAGACDYINASHIHSPVSNKRYIAAQGPLPATFEDFWSVIWDHDVRVIVMLTAETEGNQLKCHPYWRGKEFGPLRLKALSETKVSLDIDKQRSSSDASAFGISGESGRRRANTTTTLQSSGPAPQPPSQSETPYVIIRKFALSHTAHPFAPIREITHLHFPSWPDFGAPAQPSHLLALIELANVMQQAALPIDANAIVASVAAEQAGPLMGWFDEPEHDPNSRPMLVHCSAGCGRTGAFCTVDTVIDMLKRQKKNHANKHDEDGDIVMDEALSPSSVIHAHFADQYGIGGRHTDASRSRRASVDDNWLNDESVDLIAKTVEDFRGQRLSMVQSLRQFVLCYETVVEWIWRQRGSNNVTSSGRARPKSEIVESMRR